MRSPRKTHMVVFVLFLVAGLIPSACTKPTQEVVSTTSSRKTPAAFETSIPEPSATATQELTPTPTNTPDLFTIMIQAFHDYNGNEIMDEDEPPIEGVLNTTGDYECVTDADGICELGILSKGSQNIVFDTSKAIVEGLDFIFYGNDVFKSENGIHVNVEEDITLYIALGLGLLPLPMAVDGGYGGIFNGFKTLEAPTHTALDLWVDGHGEQPIFANFPGLIQSVGGECGGVVIEVRRSDLGFNANINMGHLTRIVVVQGQRVEKGEIVGYINPDLYNGTRQGPGTIEVSCTRQPHVHYGVYMPAGYPELAWTDEWDWYDPALLAPNPSDPRPMK